MIQCNCLTGLLATRAALQCKVQMERWNGTVLDINATCAELGSKCLQLLAYMLSVDAIGPPIFTEKAKQAHSTLCYQETFQV